MRAFIYEPVRDECLSQGMTETRKRRIKPGGKFVLTWGRCDKTHLWREKEASEVFDGFCRTATRLPNYYIHTWFKICILRKLLRCSWTSFHPPAPGFALLGMWTPIFQFTNVVLTEVIFGNCPLIFITSIKIWVALLNKTSSFCLKWILTENETFLLQVLISLKNVSMYSAVVTGNLIESDLVAPKPPQSYLISETGAMQLSNIHISQKRPWI